MPNGAHQMAYFSQEIEVIIFKSNKLTVRSQRPIQFLPSHGGNPAYGREQWHKTPKLPPSEAKQTQPPAQKQTQTDNPFEENAIPF